METGTQVEIERPARGRRGRLLQEGGLPELLEVLRWRWRRALLIAVLVTSGATLYIESLPSEYDGEALVSVGPRDPTGGSDIVRVLGPKYPRYITAPATIRVVAAEIGENEATLKEAVDSSIETDTGNVRIAVRLEDPVRASVAANAFAQQALEFSRTDRLLAAQLVVRAIPPDAPAAPPRRLLELASLFIGGLIGIVGSLLLERGRPRLRSWQDMAKITGYPVVGRIPPSKVLKSRPTAGLSDPSVGSSFRIMRANLEPQLRDGTIDQIVVTSPAPADGKTTVAALLAESLVRLGSKVLLVDADLRRPSLARLAQLDGHPGLSSVLRRDQTIESAVSQGWIEGLSVLPTATDPDAGDLLARRFAEVVEEAREHFDHIVVDTPPLLSTDDARTLVTGAKGVLLVVSEGTLTSSVVESVLAVEALDAQLIGLVGNRFREARVPYYYY